jgi:hypothetical protein
MKKLYTILGAILLTVSIVYCQSPDKFNYQAVIRNTDGTIRANQNVNVLIGILKGSISNSPIYIETHLKASTSLGLVNLIIGNGTVVSGALSNIDWSGGPYYLKIWVDGAELGTSQLLSVPYAKYAEKAGNGFSGNYNDLINKPNFSKWDKDSTDNVTLTGNQTISGIKTFSGTINANNRTIVNVASPLNDNDAVNKAYVDILKRQLRELQNRLFPEVPPSTNGLVAYYPFNGNANDESGNGNDGNPTQGCLWAKDRFGNSSKALFLDGNNLVSI